MLFVQLFINHHVVSHFAYTCNIKQTLRLQNECIQGTRKSGEHSKRHAANIAKQIPLSCWAESRSCSQQDPQWHIAYRRSSARSTINDGRVCVSEEQIDEITCGHPLNENKTKMYSIHWKRVRVHKTALSVEVAYKHVFVVHKQQTEFHVPLIPDS